MLFRLDHLIKAHLEKVCAEKKTTNETKVSFHLEKLLGERLSVDFSNNYEAFQFIYFSSHVRTIVSTFYSVLNLFIPLPFVVPFPFLYECVNLHLFIPMINIQAK